MTPRAWCICSSKLISRFQKYKKQYWRVLEGAPVTGGSCYVSLNEGPGLLPCYLPSSFVFPLPYHLLDCTTWGTPSKSRRRPRKWNFASVWMIILIQTFGSSTCISLVLCLSSAQHLLSCWYQPINFAIWWLLTAHCPSNGLLSPHFSTFWLLLLVMHFVPKIVHSLAITYARHCSKPASVHLLCNFLRNSCYHQLFMHSVDCEIRD